MSDNKVEDLKQSKNPVDSILNQFNEAEKKKLQEELKKALEEVMSAKQVFINAVGKAVGIEKKIKEVGSDKLDLASLAKSFGL